MREVRSDFSAVVCSPLFLYFHYFLFSMKEDRIGDSYSFYHKPLSFSDALAVELMYRPSSFALSQGGPRLVHAEVIRDLNIYVSCLSWMSGRGGNSKEFSTEVQGRLTQILDQIIDGMGGSLPVLTAEVPDSAEVRVDVVANLNHQLHSLLFHHQTGT